MRYISVFIEYIAYFVSPIAAFMWAYTIPASAQPYVSQQDPIHQPIFNDLKKTGEAVVIKILGPYTLLLDDNSVVRLNGIECLNYNPIDQSSECIQAYEKLKEIIPLGRPVSLYQTLNPKVGRMNRMDEKLAHVVLHDNKQKTWIQGAMIKDGLYRVRTTKYSPEIADKMYNLEHTARLAQVGIWSSKGKVVRTADTITANEKGFTVVEGQVQKVARVRNNVYLNFGDNWKTDFTVGVPPKLVKQFTQRGVNLTELGNHDVRVRGWVRDYNGPYIELSHIEQLEIGNTEKNSEVKPQVSLPQPDRPLSPMEKIIAQSKNTNTGFGHITVTQDDDLKDKSQ